MCNKLTETKVVLLCPDISNVAFWNVKKLKCKNFLIDFLDEFGNFKQKKNFTLQNVFFYILQQQTQIPISFSQILFVFRYCVVFRVDKAMKACKHDMDTDDLHHGKSNFVKKLKK